jgi:hypothetical protein
MSTPKVLVQQEAAPRARLDAAPDFGWTLFGWLGVVFTAVGGVDLLLTWYPLHFGNAEWEFGTVSATLDGLPVLSMGLVMLAGTGAARGQRWLLRLMSVVLVVVALVIIGAALLYVTNVPIALKAVTEPAIRTGLKKAIAKASAQSLLYPVAYLWIGWQAWRHAAARSH